jgi:hypothetical protein
MTLEHLLICGLAGLCLMLIFFRLRATNKLSLNQHTGPTPDDKYLPIWVVLCMTFSVLILSYQMTAVIKDVCGTPNQCSSPSSTDSKLSSQTGDDVAKHNIKAPTSE